MNGYLQGTCWLGIVKVTRLVMIAPVNEAEYIPLNVQYIQLEFT